MNIQNVQIQAFLERVQSKIMRKIEDEYYCGGSILQSQEQLDQFKQVWQQKLKQQFVLQNQIQLQKELNNQEEQKQDKQNILQNSLAGAEYGSNPRKILKTEQNRVKQEQSLQDSEGSSEIDATQLKTTQQNEIEKNNLICNDPKSESQPLNKNLVTDQKMGGETDKISEKQEIKGSVKAEDFDFLEYVMQDSRNKKKGAKNKEGDEDDDSEDQDNKLDQSCNFSLNSDDLEDVSDQIIGEDYFNDFDNHLIGYIGKERKTKKRCKEQNKPITSIDFQYLIGTINKQEIIMSSLRAQFVDCRK